MHACPAQQQQPRLPPFAWVAVNLSSLPQYPSYSLLTFPRNVMADTDASPSGDSSTHAEHRMEPNTASVSVPDVADAEQGLTKSLEVVPESGARAAGVEAASAGDTTQSLSEFMRAYTEKHNQRVRKRPQASA